MSYRGTYIQVNLDTIANNTRLLRASIGQTPHMMAVVKANAYGHGLVPVAKTALENGADYLGVAIPEEGESLRAAGVKAPVLVLGAANAQEAAASVRLGLIQTVFSPRQVEMLEEAAAAQGKTVQVHLKCDTGMGRIGVRTEDELKAVLRSLEEAPHVLLTGAFTHFADADRDDPAYTRMQLEKFRAFQRLLPGQLLFHAAASAAGERYPQARFSMVRQGIALYGCPSWPGVVPVAPALSWHTEIVWVKTVPPGASIGYGCTYRAESERKIATLPVGYGDGYHRALSGKAQVIVGGKRCPVVGSVCMDQIMVDVTDVPPSAACIGGEAVLLGRQGDQEITAGQLAAWAGTISYEMLLAATARVPVTYITTQGE